VDYSASSSLGTYYGAGFWTVRSPHPWAQAWIAGGMPKDAFFASGDLGQRLVVLPSQRLVIVRLGDAVDPTGDMQGLLRLMREVVAVVRQ
jgi:CubicO group peptidase (beta-lactamase class C family)